MKTSSIRTGILLLGTLALLWALAGTPKYVVVQWNGELHSVSIKSEAGKNLVDDGYHAQADFGAAMIRAAGALGCTLLLWLAAGYLGREAPLVGDFGNEAERHPNPSLPEGRTGVRVVNGLIGLLFLASPLATSGSGDERVELALILFGSVFGTVVVTSRALERQTRPTGGVVFLASVLGPLALVFLLALLFAPTVDDVAATLGTALGFGLFYGLGMLGLRYAVFGGPFWGVKAQDAGNPNRTNKADDSGPWSYDDGYSEW